MTIRLELGRMAGAPQGNPLHAYEMVAPLDARGHLDPEEWRTEKHRCAVRRFRPGEPERRGSLRHSGRAWLFDYIPNRTDDNETLFRADRHLIEKGLYVSVTEEDGVQRPFKIVEVAPVMVDGQE
jgi:hypothetical protein